METTPDEILLLIFEAVSGPALLPWPDAPYDHHRACAPFVLASVCRHWRSIAQSTPALWTYFAFSDVTSEQEGQFNRLHILVSLVKHTPIDVLFGCEDWSLFQHQLSVGTRILEQLACLVGQWRSAQFDMPDLPPSVQGPFNNILPRQSPYLEQLSVTSNGATLCLPQASHLLRLHVHCDDLDLPDPFLCLPKLCILSYFTVGDSSDYLCSSYSQHLVELYIQEDANQGFQLVELPRLATLVLDDAKFLAHIRAPHVRTLGLNANSLTMSILDATAHYTGVQHLIFWNEIREETLHFVGCFCALATLSFTVPDPVKKTFGPYGHPYTIEPGFLTEFNSWHPPVCPSLDRLLFGPGPGSLPYKELLAFVHDRRQFLEAENCRNRERLSKRLTVLLECDIGPEIPASVRTKLRELQPNMLMKMTLGFDGRLKPLLRITSSSRLEM
ncbi:hypothetical protein BKA62DRAFT_197227 [Auriculariales sp. MPI-PUGE-AT-0066]|nr:hypothetical protein BKA62DRAFT_197227 [Auriculariales sp. MPI-PUGE-AT-0066]